ncbi:hypothetical protein FRC04_001032 [Tulasnella sp. 424]|nr:hypothetical protein FRC04_001032 [Tulasnella sp. 424]KAG8977941.1 hypothetical protein FRC05_000469 [Tulasnella sp. 425]
MLAQGIVLSSLLLAGSAFADQVQARYVTTEVAVTELVAASSPFTPIINATNALNATEGVATATAYATAVTSTMAPANATACFCSIPYTANVTEAFTANVTEAFGTVNVTEAASTVNVTEAFSTAYVNGSTPTTRPIAAKATSQAVAVAASATLCPCQPAATAQATNQTTQPVGVPTTQSVSAETQGIGKNQVLNANSAVMEIVSIQLAGVFTFIGLVGASVTFL